MAEARERSEWGRMSHLLALTFNMQRDAKKTAALRPADFNPFERRERDIVIRDAPISALKVFITGKLPDNLQEATP